MDYYVDRLLRSDSAVSSAVNVISGQIGRALARFVVAPALDDGDKSYLVRETMAQTGLPVAEAEKRPTETIATFKAQADTVRRYGIVLTFLTAASLLVSAVAAWWAACTGGRHRNAGIDHSHLTRCRQSGFRQCFEFRPHHGGLFLPVGTTHGGREFSPRDSSCSELQAISKRCSGKYVKELQKSPTNHQRVMQDFD